METGCELLCYLLPGVDFELLSVGPTLEKTRLITVVLQQMRITDAVYGQDQLLFTDSDDRSHLTQSTLFSKTLINYFFFFC